MALEQFVLAVRCRQTYKQYVFFKGNEEKLAITLRQSKRGIDTTVVHKGVVEQVTDGPTDLSQSLVFIERLLRAKESDSQAQGYKVDMIGISFAAPGALFLRHQRITAAVQKKIVELSSQLAPQLSIVAEEIAQLRTVFPDKPMYGISESAFHASRSDEMWNYDIKLEVADRLDIKRFCYDGLLAESVVQTLGKSGLLEPRVIICNLDETSSVTAIKNGKSIDSTGGYGTHEGIIPSYGTSAMLSVQAIGALQQQNDNTTTKDILEDGGLQAISGISGNIPELFEREQHEYRAKLALAMFVNSAQKAIGSMIAILGGVDVFVFTGHASAEVPELRQRILKPFDYLGLAIDAKKNRQVDATFEPKTLQPRTRVKQVYLLRANEPYEIAWRARKLHKLESLS